MKAIEMLKHLHYQICNGGLEQACYNGYIDELLEEWDDPSLWIEELEKEVDERTKEGKTAIEAAIMIDNAIQKLEPIKVCQDCGGDGGSDDEFEDDEGNIDTEYVICDRCNGEGTIECNNYSDIDFEYYNTWVDKWDSEYYDKIDTDAIDDLTGQSHTHSVVLDTIKGESYKNKGNLLKESKNILKNDVLLYVPSKKELLKIQQGTGDNLEEEDYDNGYIGYYLWSIFQPSDLGIDEELNMDCINSGMVMYTEDDDPTTILENILEDIYGESNIKTKLLFTDKDI